MAVDNTPTTMAGFHKIVYPDGPVSLVSDSMKLQKLHPFKQTEKIGKYLSVSTDVAMEGGMTYNGTTGALNSSLQAAIAAESVDIQVTSPELIFRSRITSKTAKAASGGKTSYLKAVDKVYRNAVKSFSKRLEIGFLWGQYTKGIGQVSGTPATNGSNKVITIADAEWSGALWAGLKSARLDIYSTGGTQRTNSGTACLIVNVNIANKTIEVSGDSGDLGDIADTDYIFFYGSRSNDQMGLIQQCSSTGTVFGVDRTNYQDTLVGVSETSVGTPTIQAFLRGAAKAADRGAEGDFRVWLPNKAYVQLVVNEAALRRHGGERTKLQNGAEELKFFSPTGGNLILEAHPYMKDGYAFGYVTDEVSRPGASDISDGDGVSDLLWYPVADSNAAEMRLYADFNPFHEAPSHSILWSGLTYPA